MSDPMYERIDWRSEFTESALSALRIVLPEAINAAQVRSSRAHTEYQDPDDHQYIYGVGMAHGAPKECQARLRLLRGYSDRPVPRSTRVTMHLGNHLIHVQRVGSKMPRNHLRVRLSYLSESRRDSFARASNDKYAQPPAVPLFTLPSDDALATLDEAAASASTHDGALFVAYYSSTPFALGKMYFAPAQLKGSYLEFTDPEPLIYRRTGVSAPAETTEARPVARRFASGERPRTSARLRDE